MVGSLSKVSSLQQEHVNYRAQGPRLLLQSLRLTVDAASYVPIFPELLGSVQVVWHRISLYGCQGAVIHGEEAPHQARA